MEEAMRSLLEMCRTNQAGGAPVDLMQLREMVLQGEAPPGGGAGGSPAAPALPCATAGLLALGGGKKSGVGGFNMDSFLKDLDSSDSSDDAIPKPQAGSSGAGDDLPEEDLPADGEPPGVPPEDALSEACVDEDVLMRSMECLGHAEVAWQRGNHFKALAVLGQAIESNPSQALLYSTRAAYHLKLRRPRSTIQDCNAALAINPISAQAHKVKGRAYGLLKKWDSAVHHLRLGNQLSYDEGSYRHQKKAEAKCKEKRLEDLVKGQAGTDHAA
eukprot:TRINITY_DN22869_c0_g1_i1.p2 TRINITY_DN22869_c0_g1~~TRINITY_DN22869_c0_g1_i1.p2  ORF type:complete len:272 (+),score=116.16 TRINITY_DN22869_c0_g1_i1:75-890(+)